MSTVCYCGHPDCPVTAMNRDACLRNLRARAEKAELTAFSAFCRKLLAHVDGEPARLAAAREEQRAACAEAVESVRSYEYDEAEKGDYVDAVRATPLKEDNK